MAIATASSSLLYFMTQRTGPKISSWAIVISLVTSVNTVGFTNAPFARSPSVACSPPQARVAPSALPFSI